MYYHSKRNVNRMIIFYRQLFRSVIYLFTLYSDFIVLAVVVIILVSKKNY